MLTGPAALFRYGVAIGAVLVATALSLAFEPVINRIPFAFYFAAVVVGAHVGGLGPGLVATGLGLLAAAYFVFPPKYALWPMGTEEGVALLFLGLVSCTINWAIAGLGQARARAEAAEAAEHRQGEWFDTTLSSIGDAVIATDEQGAVVFMNPVAQSLTGWTQDEAVGRSLADIFRIFNELSHEPAESPGARVLREHTVVGLSAHTVLRARDGSERAIDDSAAPIRRRDGSVGGVVLVFRDVSERREAEKALAESERRLRMALDAARMVAWEWDPVADAVFATPNIADVYGVPGFKNTQEGFALVHPDDVPRHQALVGGVMATGGAYRSVFRIVRPDTNAVAWLEERATAVVDDTGRVVGLNGVVMDITDAKRAEEELGRSRALLEEAQRSGHIGSWEWDIASNTVTWSDELYRIYGLEPGSLAVTFERFVELVPAQDRERVGAIIETAYRERQPFAFEHQIVRPDGEIRTLQANGRVIVDAAGEAIGMVGSDQDITERTQAEAALRESEERLRAVWESAADAMALSDPSGIVLAANPAYYRLTRYPPEQVIGHNFTLIFPEEQRADAAEQYLSVFGADDRVPRFSTILRRADGSELPVEAHYDFVVQGGQRIAMVSMVRDISERRALERLQREFIAMVGHELRNPLTSLRGHAQLMKRRQRFAERSVDVIIEQANRLERLIRDLTDVSQLESGRLTLQLEPMDLVDLVHACAEQARGQAEGHVVRIDDPDAPIMGSWDRDRLGQVLTNLLSNAIKYSPDGGEILVSVKSEEAETVVTVRDRGLGIPPVQLPHLFDRFYRVQETAATASGLGLGLYISKLLIEAHGGRMWVESEGLGQGSTFSFVLPIAPVAEAMTLVE